jgi:hypothetical protein
LGRLDNDAQTDVEYQTICRMKINDGRGLDPESRISFTPGGATGPGTKARFNDNEILIVHTDGDCPVVGSSLFYCPASPR